MTGTTRMTNTIVSQISGNTARVNEATQHLIVLAAEPGCGLARDSALIATNLLTRLNSAHLVKPWQENRLLGRCALSIAGFTLVRRAGMIQNIPRGLRSFDNCSKSGQKWVAGGRQQRGVDSLRPTTRHPG
jgi:hypothetical protein